MAISKGCKLLLCLLYSTLLFVSGVLLFICSIFLGHKLLYYFKLVPSECIGPFVLILLMSLGHIALTWIGFKGPRTKNVFYITLFIAITFVFVLCEIAVAVWALVLNGSLDEKSTELMTSSFEEFVKSNFNYDKLDWVRLQSQFECCGINKVEDYTALGSIPFSCCSASATTTCNKIYTHGCKEFLVQHIKNLSFYLALAGFCSALFQILGLVTYYFFYKTVKQQAAEDVKRRTSVLQEVNPLNKQHASRQRSNSQHKQLPSKQ